MSLYNKKSGELLYVGLSVKFHDDTVCQVIQLQQNHEIVQIICNHRLLVQHKHTETVKMIGMISNKYKSDSVVTNQTRIREVPGSNPGADQPDWIFRGFPQLSRQMLG